MDSRDTAATDSAETHLLPTCINPTTGRRESVALNDIKKSLGVFGDIEKLKDYTPEVKSYISARDHEAELQKLEKTFVENLLQRFVKNSKYNIEI